MNLLAELATLKVLNRRFIEYRDSDTSTAAERSQSRNLYFAAVEALAKSYGVKPIDLAWRLTFDFTWPDFAVV